MNTKLTLVALAAAVVSGNALTCNGGNTGPETCTTHEAPNAHLTETLCFTFTATDSDSPGVSASTYGCASPAASLTAGAPASCKTTGTITTCKCACDTDDCNTGDCEAGAVVVPTVPTKTTTKTMDVRYPNVDFTECCGDALKKAAFLLACTTAQTTANNGVMCTDVKAGSAVITFSGTAAALETAQAANVATFNKPDGSAYDTSNPSVVVAPTNNGAAQLFLSGASTAMAVFATVFLN